MSYAVYCDGQRAGSAWKARSGGWRYKSLDGATALTAYTLPAIRDAVKRELREHPLAPARRRDRPDVPNLLCCW